MKLAKLTQVYISLASVFVIALIGATGFIVKSGQLPSIQADVTSQQIGPPTLSIRTDQNPITLGSDHNIYIEGKFENNPVTGAHILFSYPSQLIDIEKVDTTAGILSSAQETRVDPVTGTVSLTFLPLIGSIKNGSLVTIQFKAKAPGKADLNLETETQLSELSSTVVTTPTQLNITPKIIGTSLVIR